MSVLTSNGFNFCLDVRLFGVDYVASKLMGNGKYLAYCVKVSTLGRDTRVSVTCNTQPHSNSIWFVHAYSVLDDKQPQALASGYRPYTTKVTYCTFSTCTSCHSGYLMSHT